jgi:HPt (histidine-containing phosphotransfer) domain-containing protein
MFIPDAATRINRINEAIKQSDFKALEEAAHGLKSGAGNIGAIEMARLSADLETCGETKSLGDAEQLAKQLSESWTAVKRQLVFYR